MVVPRLCCTPNKKQNEKNTPRRSYSRATIFFFKGEEGCDNCTRRCKSVVVPFSTVCFHSHPPLLGAPSGALRPMDEVDWAMLLVRDQTPTPNSVVTKLVFGKRAKYFPLFSRICLKFLLFPPSSQTCHGLGRKTYRFLHISDGFGPHFFSF